MCVCGLFACAYTLGDLIDSLIENIFVESAQNLTGEISGQAESLACNSHIHTHDTHAHTHTYTHALSLCFL